MLARFPVVAQIGAGFALALLLLVSVGAAEYASISQMRARAAEAAALTNISALAGDVLTQLLQEESAVRGYAATHDPRFFADGAAGKTGAARDLAALDRSDQTKVISSNRLEQIDIVTAQIEDDVKTLDPLFARRDLQAERTAFAKVRTDRDALWNYTSRGAFASTAAFEAARRTVVFTLIAGTLLAALAFAIAAGIVSRSIARRLAAITSALREVAATDIPQLVAAFESLAQGDLGSTFAYSRAELDARGADEIAALCGSYNAVSAGLRKIAVEFDEMTLRLQATIACISDSAGDLAGVSGEVADATTESRVAVSQIHAAVEQVVSGANQQASHLLQARCEVEDLTQSARAIADGAADQERATISAASAMNGLNEEIARFGVLGQTLAAGAEQSRLRANAGIDAVSQTARAIAQLGDSTAQALKAMRTLEERSAKVSEIVSVIDEMADQTNLLALNAAIEAARAGEHGRGFAVVASEVRQLAEQSRRSTSEIRDILTGIRAETVRCAQSIAQAATQTQTGLTLSSSAGTVLQEMAAAIAQTAGIADEVAARSDAMQRASESLAGDIGNVLRVIERNARIAQDVSGTTQTVLDRIMPVAASADQQARTALEVSGATASLDKQIAAIEGSSRSSLAQSEQLRLLISAFNIGTGRTLAIAGDER
ncbi:MAG TPA: methyl-accepting chemotaxis protein [Candidatus Baltobacteraceae bacterium]|nr:methyl-accepting chemotaxis protein [Candidatus Baltobacteraceae bacterium]